MYPQFCWNDRFSIDAVCLFFWCAVRAGYPQTTCACVLFFSDFLMRRTRAVAQQIRNLLHLLERFLMQKRMFQDILQQWLAWSAVTLLVRQAVLCQAPLASLRPLFLCCALSRCGQQRWASGTPSKKQTIFQCTKSSFVALRAHSECNKKILLRISQTEIASIFFCCFFAETIVFSLLTSLRQKMFFSPFMFFDALLAGVKFATCFLLKFCWNDCFFPFWPCCVWFCFQPRTKSHPQVKSWTTRFPPNCR